RRITPPGASRTALPPGARADPRGSRRAGSVRAGSIACQTAARVERYPDGLPLASNGELAKQAVSTGPRSWARCQRASVVAGLPTSRFTWIDAVLRIIVRPAGHRESKYDSIAR